MDGKLQNYHNNSTSVLLGLYEHINDINDICIIQHKRMSNIQHESMRVLKEMHRISEQIFK